MKNLFKEAHKLTKEMVEKYGDVDYQVQFGLFVSFLIEEEKGMKLETKEDVKNLIKKNMDAVETERNFEITSFEMNEWKNYGKHRVYINIQLDHQRRFEGFLEILEEEVKFYVNEWGARRYNEDTIEAIRKTINVNRKDIVKVVA